MVLGGSGAMSGCGVTGCHAVGSGCVSGVLWVALAVSGSGVVL